MTPDEILAFVVEVESRAEKATPGPWFDAYRCVHSKPLTDESIRLESLIPANADTTHPTFAAWEAFPESDVCAVPAVGGDTPTEQGAKDAEFIAHAREDVPRLCQIVREQAANLDYHLKSIQWLQAEVGAHKKVLEISARTSSELYADELRLRESIQQENATLRERLAKLEAATKIAIDVFEYERRVTLDNPEDGNELSRAKDGTDAAMDELGKLTKGSANGEA